MNEYAVKPVAKADLDVLLEAMSARRIPYTDTKEGSTRIVRIGPDNDFEVHEKRGRIGGRSVKIFLRYEQPMLKTLIADWIDESGARIDDEFFTWHMALSPSVLAGIKSRWSVDLTGLEATPVKIGQLALVFMFASNVDSELSEQLADMPHRPMAKDEFLECADFVAKGDDPNDPIIYRWRSEAGSDLFAVVASAPALTMLSLWIIPEGAPARHNIGELTNETVDSTR